MTVLGSGWMAEQIDSAFAPRAKDIARRKEGITGVSEFPNVGEEPHHSAARRPGDGPRRGRAARVASYGATGAPIAAVGTASRRDGRRSRGGQRKARRSARLAQALGFQSETTRDHAAEVTQLRRTVRGDARCERRLASNSRTSTPRFPGQLGSGIALHGTRDLRQELLRGRGLRGGWQRRVTPTPMRPPAALADSGAKIAVICSSDKLYPELVPVAAAKLKAAGARSVVLAGHPGR